MRQHLPKFVTCCLFCKKSKIRQILFSINSAQLDFKIVNNNCHILPTFYHLCFVKVNSNIQNEYLYSFFAAQSRKIGLATFSVISFSMKVLQAKSASSGFLSNLHDSDNLMMAVNSYITNSPKSQHNQHSTSDSS